MQNKKTIMIFLVKFFVIFTVLHYLLLAIDIGFFEKAITAFQANLIGAEFEGNKIFLENSALVIVASCTGLVSTIILGAIIFSLKKPAIKEKIGIFLGGAILLLIINQFRLYLVISSGKIFGIQTAELVHTISWFATTGAIIFAWHYFTKKTTKQKNFEGFL